MVVQIKTQLCNSALSELQHKDMLHSQAEFPDAGIIAPRPIHQTLSVISLDTSGTGGCSILLCVRFCPHNIYRTAHQNLYGLYCTGFQTCSGSFDTPRQITINGISTRGVKRACTCTSNIGFIDGITL